MCTSHLRLLRLAETPLVHSGGTLASGMLKDVGVVPHNEFWPFLGPLFSRCFHTMMNFGHFLASPRP